ncbi:hypothetical protein H4219_004549 [Mycoemilia scoparia]|uniref:EamA domain-containing protein n=1 Tax=Mycoemilia scoparia TaxID=417184 RepID=A0A9W8DR64_9FUNG|nr:hypothetical protein H4219_004549 [Mycoemilia scoparia]
MSLQSAPLAERITTATSNLITAAARSALTKQNDTTNGGVIGGKGLSQWRRMMFGGLSLFVCIVSFTFQTVVSRKIQDKMNYNHPYFILWVSHSFWIALLPLHYFYEKMKPGAKSTHTLQEELMLGSAKVVLQTSWRGKYDALNDDSGEGRSVEEVRSASDFIDDDDDDYEGNEFGIHERQNNSNSNNDDEENNGSHNNGRGQSAGIPGAAVLSAEELQTINEDKRALRLARTMPHHVFIHIAIATVLIALVLNSGAYLWYAAVTFTSISKLTAIYNTSCFFAYLFSVLLLGDKIKFSKCLAIVISIGGVLLMTLWNSDDGNGGTIGEDNQDSSISNNKAIAMKTDASSTSSILPKRSIGIASKTELIGDLMSVVSAVLIGLYQVLYKKYMAPKNFHSLFFVNVLTAMLGAATLLVMWFPLPILSIIKFEPFAWPTRSQLYMIFANAFFGVAYNGGYMVMLALTSPLFASVGVMLTIPILSIIDMFMQHSLLQWNVFVGGCGILVGFGILTWAQTKDMKKSAEAATETSNEDWQIESSSHTNATQNSGGSRRR